MILPIPHLMDFGTRAPAPEGRPRIHLLLSHLMWPTNPLMEDYVAYYQMRRERGDYLIMDNGADESVVGQGERVEAVLLCAKRVRAQEIVLPDVQEDRHATERNTLEAIDWLRTYDGRIAYNTAGRPRLMLVPQGKDLNEWGQCCDKLIHAVRGLMASVEGPPPVIAVAKQYDRIFSEGRLTGLRYLETIKDKEEDIHLLGYPRGVYDVPLIEDTFPGMVRSVDSAKPVVYAMNGMMVDPIANQGYLPEYPLRPDKYFQQELERKHEVYLAHNIEKFCV